MHFLTPSLTSIIDDRTLQHQVQIDILRLDQLHPQISGNKWFKLKYNLDESINLNAKEILSFGGAYSNHLHALAFAGKEYGIKTIGIIRGNEVLNDTLNDCKNWGMELHFISRENYRHKTDEEFLQSIQSEFPNAYIIPEGGNNALGRKGCEEILSGIDLSSYSHICCAIGTGATFSGIINSSIPSNHILGFSSLKNGLYLEDEIRNWTHHTNWFMIHDYHFGGFGKRTNELIQFMNEFNQLFNIDLDIVYTSKMLFGVFDLIVKNYFNTNSKILVIHSGGVQGNCSLSLK